MILRDQKSWSGRSATERLFWSMDNSIELVSRSTDWVARDRYLIFPPFFHPFMLSLVTLSNLYMLSCFLFCFLDWLSNILMFIPLLPLRHPPRPFLKLAVACT